MEKNYSKEMKARVKIIRLRTWTLTLTILALLVLYIFVTLSIKSSIDWIDFAIAAAIQISTHFAYFADGERYGETDKHFISTRDAYIKSVSLITTESTVEKLREYCEVEFQQRKDDYLNDMCNRLDISREDLCEITKLSAKKIRHLKQWDTKTNGTVYFNMEKRAILRKLVFGANPVQKNQSSTIMSAVDRDYTESIKNGQKVYKKGVNIFKGFIKPIMLGGILAYITYNMRAGLSFAAIIKSCVFIGSMITTAVSSYIAGEKSTRDYKMQFFVELATFIGDFFSWAGIPMTKEVAEETTTEKS